MNNDQYNIRLNAITLVDPKSVVTPLAFKIQFDWNGTQYSILKEWRDFLTLNQTLSELAPDAPRLDPPWHLWKSEKDPIVIQERKALLEAWFSKVLSSTHVSISVPFSQFLSSTRQTTHISLENPTKCGFLTKEGHIIKNWKKRWFVLQGTTLFYFPTKTCDSLAGSIPLHQMTVRVASEKNIPHCFTIRPAKNNMSAKVFFLIATEDADMRQWIQALSSACQSQHITHIHERVASKPLHRRLSKAPTNLVNAPEFVGPRKLDYSPTVLFSEADYHMQLDQINTLVQQNFSDFIEDCSHVSLAKFTSLAQVEEIMNEVNVLIDFARQIQAHNAEFLIQHPELLPDIIQKSIAFEKTCHSGLGAFVTRFLYLCTLVSRMLAEAQRATPRSTPKAEQSSFKVTVPPRSHSAPKITAPPFAPRLSLDQVHIRTNTTRKENAEEKIVSPRLSAESNNEGSPRKLRDSQPRSPRRIKLRESDGRPTPPSVSSPMSPRKGTAMVCRLCGALYKGFELEAHSKYCYIFQSSDTNSQNDGRLYKFIDTLNELADRPQNLTPRPHMEALCSLAESAAGVRAVTLWQIPVLHTHTLETILKQIAPYQTEAYDILVRTAAGKLYGIVRRKCSSIAEYMQASKPLPTPHTGISKAMSGFLSLFWNSTPPQNPSTQTTPPLVKWKEPGVCIQDFAIIKPIARGAYGRVFLCKKKNTGDLYAIKVLRKEDLVRKNQEDTILTERNALARAQHPFIVNLFYAFQSKEYIYLVMEFLLGGDLSSLLEGLTYFEEPMVMAYIAELVLVLEYLHSIGIIHRDLKPSNILVNTDGHIKLTDFGLSKIGVWDYVSQPNKSTPGPLIDLSSAQDTTTSDDRILGTPDYLAPEILLGQKAGFAADWWAVGVITFEFFTGVTPFGDQTPEGVFAHILKREIYDWPEELAVTDAAKDFVDKLLASDPAMRLGANGIEEIKNHPFFNGVKWDTVFSTPMDGIFVPKIANQEDTSYFMTKDGSYSDDIFSTSAQHDSQAGTSFDPKRIPDLAFTNLQSLREKNKNELMKLIHVRTWESEIENQDDDDEASISSGEEEPASEDPDLLDWEDLQKTLN